MTQFSADQVEVLKVSAQNFGVNPSVIANILATWGPVVLSTVVEGLRSGLTVDFIMEVLNKFGPAVLTLLLNLFHQKKMLASGVADTFPPGDPNGISTSILVTILDQIVPIIFQQFGTQILAAIQTAILNAINNNLQQQAAAATAVK